MGGGAGLGGKDRRSRGGAVIPVLWRKQARIRCGSVLLFILVTGLAACARQNKVPARDAATVLRSIPPADASKYPALQETKHWGNPYLVIRVDRVGLLTDITANEEQILKPGEVLEALAQLPATAWPYGRAVAVLVDEKPSAPELDKIELRRNRGIVEGELRGAQVAIRWIPSS